MTTSNDSESLLVTVPEAAKILGIGKSLLWGLLYRDEIPSVRLGRRRLIARKTLHDIARGRDVGALPAVNGQAATAAAPSSADTRHDVAS